MYGIQICPIKKLYTIAEEADLSEVAALIVSSYEIDENKLKGCFQVSVYHFQDIVMQTRNIHLTRKPQKKLKILF